MNILLVGDLRNVYNYGAIATTESLYNLIKSKQCNIDTIDYRAMMEAAPADGYNITVEEICQQRERLMLSPANALKHRIKKTRLFNIYKDFSSYGKKSANNQCEKMPHIPYKFEDYEAYSAEVLNGKKLPYEYKKIKNADLIIINGEGNIVNGTDSRGIYRTGGLYILFMAYLCKVVLQKETYIINHTVDPKNDEIKKIIQYIYPKLDGVYVRERLSLRLLEQWGIDNAEYVPDALFSANFEDSLNRDFSERFKLEKIDFSKPYICIGDSSAIINKNGKIGWDIEKTYTSLIKKLKKICPQIVFVDGFSNGCSEINKAINKCNIPVVSLYNADYKDLYRVFSNPNCKIFISGRWHSSILALMAKCPILLWGADSHKTRALYDLIDYEYKFFDINKLPELQDEIVCEAKKVLCADNEKYFKAIEEIRKLSKNNVNMI